jgi:hypothetical protein
MTDVDLHIVNTYALEPGKVYLIEVDRDRIGQSTLRGMMEALAHYGIKGVLVRSIGGKAVRLVPSPQEEQP